MIKMNKRGVGKRGISGVVTAILLILLAIAAVIIVWSVIKPLISNKGTDTDVLSVNLKIEKAEVDEDGNFLVRIKREPGAGNVDKISIVFSDDSGNEQVNTTLVGLDELETKTFNFIMKTGLTPTKVDVYPVLIKDGQEIIGIKEEAKIVSGNIGCNTDDCIDMLFGTVVQETFWTGDEDADKSDTYKARFKELYSYGVTAHSGRMQNIQPSKDVYDYTKLDALLTWAEANNIKIKFHRLATEQALPTWFTDLNQADSRAYLEAHIRNITRKYNGRIFMYDVVNHPIQYETPDNFMGTGWTKEVAIRNIFTWAREEDSSAILIINEGQVTTNPITRASYIELIQDLLASGTPIDGVGIMEHLGTGTSQLPDDVTIINALNELDILGLPIYVTEFDLNSSSINTENNFIANDITYETWGDYQAYAYEHAYTLFASHSSVASIASWGFYDGYIWRGGAGLFDTSFNPKSAYNALEPILTCMKKCEGV